jgi:hypothetical protein
MAVPGTAISINTAAPPDNRSYKVSFARFRQLAPDHQPRVSLPASIAGLRDGLTAIGFNDRDFRSSQFVRLKVLERLMDQGRLDNQLAWTSAAWGAA